MARLAAVPLWKNLQGEGDDHVGLSHFRAFLPSEQAACRGFYLCLPPHKRALVDGQPSDDSSDTRSASDASAGGEQRTTVNLFLRPGTATWQPRLHFDPLTFVGLVLRRHEFVEAMAEFAAERRQLALALTDWSSFSDVLNSVSRIIHVGVVFFVVLAMYSTNLTAAIVPLTSFVVSFSFIFGNRSHSPLPTAGGGDERHQIISPHHRCLPLSLCLAACVASRPCWRACCSSS